MIRVLHLFGVQSTLQTEHGVSLLTDPTGQDLRSASLTIGRGGDFRSTLGAAASLRFGHPAFDLIHAWDAQAFIAAVASGLPVVFSPERRFGPGTWSWLATAAYHDVQVVSPTRWGCNRQISEGLSPERCHFIVPGYEAPEPSADADSELRARLGILPGQFVILAPGESSRAARHRVAWHAAAILGVLDERFRLLIWGRGPEARLVRDLGGKVNQSQLVVDAEKRLGRDVSFEELVGAADVTLFTGTSDAPVLPLAACAAAGLPVLATDSALVRETFGPDDAVVVPPKDVRTLSQRLLELKESPARRAILGAAAKARAGNAFGAARFVTEFRALYRRVVEKHGGSVTGASPIPEPMAAMTDAGQV